MRILLRNPRREVELAGPITVDALLRRLELNAEAVLVIADDELVPRDARLPDTAVVEIRPVISGGSGTPDTPSLPAGTPADTPAGEHP